MEKNSPLSNSKLKFAYKVSEFAENIINTIREPLLVLDKDLRVVKASRSFYEFFKVTSDETIGMLIYDLGNGQWNIPKLKELLETILPEKTTFDNYEVDHVFSKIGKRILLLNARKILRELEKEQIILLAIEDITERKIAEKLAGENSRVACEYLDILFNHAHAPIIIWDTSLVITHINHAFEKLSGYDWTELKDKKLDIFFPKDKIGSTLELVKDTLLRDERSDIIEIDILTKDKNLKTVLWNPANILDRGGNHIVATIAQDYTKHKRTEEALTILETRYRRLFESAKDGILILNAETGNIIDVNPFLIELLGYTKEQLLEKEIWEIGFFKDIADNKEKFLELQQKGYVRYEDLPLETADGRKISVEFVSNVYLVNNRKVIQCNIRDNTERKQAEDILRKSEYEFRILVESIPQMVWITQPDGWNIYFNQQWVDYTGQTLDESSGHGWNKPFHPDDKQLAWEAWQNATENNATYSINSRIRRADGVYNWYLVRGVPLIDENGVILKWFGSCTNINELKLAEKELQESEEKYRKLVEGSPDAIAIHVEGKIVYANRSCLTLLRASNAEELIGKSAIDFVSPIHKELVIKRMAEIIRTGEAVLSAEEIFLRLDGSEVDVEVKSMPVTYDNKPAILT